MSGVVLPARELVAPELRELAAVVGSLGAREHERLPVGGEERRGVAARVLGRQVLERAAAVGRHQVDVAVGKIAVGRRRGVELDGDALPVGGHVVVDLAVGREAPVVARRQVLELPGLDVHEHQAVRVIVGQVVVEVAVLPVLGDPGRHLRVAALLGFLLHRREVRGRQRAGETRDDRGRRRAGRGRPASSAAPGPRTAARRSPAARRRPPPSRRAPCSRRHRASR